MTASPPPGSPAAVAMGCECPRIDNGYGRGMYTDAAGRPVYVYTMGCPVHTDEGGEGDG